MTKEQLQTRIEKKKQDIAKIEKRIAKWTKGMNPEAEALCAASELTYNDPGYEQAYRNYIAYERNHKDDKTVYNADWNKVPCLAAWRHPNGTCILQRKSGVSTGSRTQDLQSHNLAL